MSPFATHRSVEAQYFVVTLATFVGSSQKGGDGTLHFTACLYNRFACLECNHTSKLIVVLFDAVCHMA
jgi:hypothetical protein